MMKVIAIVFLMATVINVACGNNLKCSAPIPDINTEWVNMESACVEATRKQIEMEFTAATNYLVMAAYFSRDTVNRPGFAEMFFKAAREEREHGSKLIEYLSMRGGLTSRISSLFSVPTVEKLEWNNGVDALDTALQMEIEVTNSIRNLIETCEGNNNTKKKNNKNHNEIRNDYHLVDYLTGVYLEEQLNGQRQLAGQLITLKKMMDKHGALGEFLFDKNL